MSSFCLTCSSEISLTALPSSYLTPCCSTPICQACVSRNSRLKDYIPCLRCGDVTSAEGSERVRKGREQVRKQREEEERGVFGIGDESDEEEQGDPPEYQAVEEEPERASMVQSDRKEMEGEKQDGRDEMEEVEIKHPLSKGDTILSIARKYAADPHEIVKLNALPPSVLSTQSHLLRTRRTLVISRRLVPRLSLPDNTLFTTDQLDNLQSDQSSSSTTDEEQHRQRQRAIKRFQLLTKTQDPSVGKAYLGLSELEEENALLDEGRDEHTGQSGKKVVKDQENREDRAVEAFYGDEEWEEQVGGLERHNGGSKWKTVGNPSVVGSKV